MSDFKGLLWEGTLLGQGSTRPLPTWAEKIPGVKASGQNELTIDWTFLATETITRHYVPQYVCSREECINMKHQVRLF